MLKEPKRIIAEEPAAQEYPIAIVILGIIAMIIQGKLKKVIEFIINYF